MNYLGLMLILLLSLSFRVQGMDSVKNKSKLVQQVVYPQPVSKGDVRFEVYVAVLRAALEATKHDFGAYQLKPASSAMSEARYMKELALQRSGLNVAWSGATYVDIASLHAVKVPIVKGLLSYRFLLVHKAQLTRFAKVVDLKGLRGETTAHAHGWGDSLVFDNAGLDYLESSYEGIFDLLQHGRVDYLSRGATEVLDELVARDVSTPDLRIAPNLMLFYPWPYYFYVHRESRELEQRLMTGMQRIQKSGEHGKLIRRYFAEELLMLTVTGRTVLRLDNPWLEANWKDDYSEYWYVPEGLQLDEALGSASAQP